MSTRRTALLSLVLSLQATAMFAQDRDLMIRAKRNTKGAVSAKVGDVTIELGSYHALLIGINDYQTQPKLKTAVSDVERLGKLLKASYGFEHVHLLRNREATRRGILKALRRYRTLGKTDNLLLYYAGHGHQVNRTMDGFWIPVDGDKEEESWISIADLQRNLKNIAAKHVLVVSDSCFAGTLSRMAVKLPTEDHFLREVHRKDSYQVITSGGLEPVSDSGRDGLSLFAYHFVSYLTDQPAPYITAGRLFDEVAPLVSNTSKSKQTPEHGRLPGTFDRRGEFVFARVGRPIRPDPTPIPTPVPSPRPLPPKLKIPPTISLNRNGGIALLKDVTTKTSYAFQATLTDDEGLGRFFVGERERFLPLDVKKHTANLSVPLQVGRNVIRLKLTDVTGLSAERAIVVERRLPKLRGLAPRKIAGYEYLGLNSRNRHEFRQSKTGLAFVYIE
ncbi:MAG: caspase family protein [Planctomycetota bacterium]